MKKTIRIILLLLVVLGAAFFILRTPDTDRTEMIAKYGNEASRFLDDGHGGKIHYRDEGNKDVRRSSDSRIEQLEPILDP